MPNFIDVKYWKATIRVKSDGSMRAKFYLNELIHVKGSNGMERRTSIIHMPYDNDCVTVDWKEKTIKTDGNVRLDISRTGYVWLAPIMYSIAEKFRNDINAIIHPNRIN